MATADTIWASIEARKQEISQIERVLRSTQLDGVAAVERQRLRRELDALNARLVTVKTRVFNQQSINREVDDDVAGPYLPEDIGESNHSVLDCDEEVLDGNLEWTIKGFSWLRTALGQNGEKIAMSQPICVSGHQFHLCYSPTSGEMGEFEQRASLAICHYEELTSDGVSFRYSIWVKSQERGYVQWGESIQVYEEGQSDDMLFGPDVCDASAILRGIFGMTYEQLLNSEWVVNDTFVTKVQIRVRPRVAYRESYQPMMPPGNYSEKVVRLLESGSNSNATFIVQGEEVRAHSFFRAFLHYVYSEDFVALESVLKQATIQRAIAERNDSSDSTPEAGSDDRSTLLQQILALSRNYQEAHL